MVIYTLVKVDAGVLPTHPTITQHIVHTPQEAADLIVDTESSWDAMFEIDDVDEVKARIAAQVGAEETCSFKTAKTLRWECKRVEIG